MSFSDALIPEKNTVYISCGKYKPTLLDNVIRGYLVKIISFLLSVHLAFGSHWLTVRLVEALMDEEE